MEMTAFILCNVLILLLHFTRHFKKVESFNIFPYNNNAGVLTKTKRSSLPAIDLWKQHHKPFISRLYAQNKNNGDGLSRGDARGAALLLEEVSVSRGSTQILRDINWRIEPNEKWGLVGSNGCGKSTLLKTIMNEVVKDDGKITIGTTQTIGYLQQTAVSGSTKSVYDEACSAMHQIEQARQRLRQAELVVAAHNNKKGIDNSTTTSSSSSLEQDMKILDRAIQQYEIVGGYQQEKTVSELLHGLGFTNITQPCDELSGGWQMRVSFARLLLSEPTLCLLDEPSNHLDRNARSWLANYLKNYNQGAMILVTHDKELLSSCQHIAEITSGSIQVYKSCSYEDYIKLKQERAQAAKTEYQRNIEKATKLQNFVDKYGASATKASAAQSRVKQIEKMKSQGLLEEPSQNIIEQRYKPKLILPKPPKAIGEILLSLEDNAMIGYRDDTNDIIISLLSNVQLEIKLGMKILIRGPNGAGKTTLLDTLRGTLPLLQGRRVENPSLRLGIFTQDLAQELEVSKRAMDIVLEYARSDDDGDITISNEQARGVLGGLGLQGEKALRVVGGLSGGEKARVALAMFALKPSNLYLLDEVSNHLDVECVEALSESLSEWGDKDGALVVISHDKTFCEQIGFTHVLTIQDNGSIKLEQRNTNDNDWDTSISTLQKSLVNDVDETSATTSVQSLELDAKDRKRAYNAPKRISKIESLIEWKEKEIGDLEEQMLANGDDVGLLVDLTKQKQNLEQEVTDLMEEWEDLETLLASIEPSVSASV